MTSLRQKLKQAAFDLLRWRGYTITRKSQALIENPDLEIALTFDHILARYLLENGPDDFFFIQVGAYDGVTNDPICAYIRRYGWHGVLLEPQRDAFRLLQENYRDQPQLRLLNTALGAQDGMQDFYRVKDVEGLPAWSRQIASFKLDNILKHKHGVPDYGITDTIPDIEKLVEVEKVLCVTFNTLLDEAGIREVDLLQIDAEGFDYEVIKTIDFDRFKPRILHYEHMHLSDRDRDECVVRLLKNGYRIATGFADTTAVLG